MNFLKRKRMEWIDESAHDSRQYHPLPRDISAESPRLARFDGQLGSRTEIPPEPDAQRVLARVDTHPQLAAQCGDPSPFTVDVDHEPPAPGLPTHW